MDPLVVEVGAWFLTKWRSRLTQASTFAVALQMRKQGIPLDVALYTLTGRVS